MKQRVAEQGEVEWSKTEALYKLYQNLIHIPILVLPSDTSKQYIRSPGVNSTPWPLLLVEKQY